METIKISEIKHQIQEHLSSAKKLQNILDLIEDVYPTTVSKQVIKPKVGSQENLFPSVDGKKTFAEKVIGILSDDIPRRGKDIYKDLETDMEYNSFSAQLSTLVKKGKIVKVTYNTTNIKDKYFYKLE